MPDKIEVGEYIRTKNGEIGIFDRYSKRPDTSVYKSPFNCFIRLQGRKTPLQCHSDYITKHSKNIIDLIEVGDIVFLKNIKGDEFAFKAEIHDEKTMYDFKIAIDYKEIKLLSILTHEKYEANCYEVEE